MVLVVVQELDLVVMIEQVVQEILHQEVHHKVMMVVIQHIMPLVEAVVLEHKEKTEPVVQQQHFLVVQVVLELKFL